MTYDIDASKFGVIKITCEDEYSDITLFTSKDEDEYQKLIISLIRNLIQYPK